MKTFSRRARQRYGGLGPGTNPRPAKRSRHNQYGAKATLLGERNPIRHGIPSPTIEQGVITTTVFAARKQFALRKMAAGTTGQGLVIPGAGTSEDPVFDIRPGDPLFATVADLEHTGGNAPPVFTCLNGMKITEARTSADLDQRLVFMGFAGDGYQFGHVSKDLLPMTLDASTTRTIVNNGTLPLYPGDIVGYKTPYYNMLPPVPDPTLGPVVQSHRRAVNQQWVTDVSGHPETVRVLPHLTKVTPGSLVVSDEHVFNKLLQSTRLIDLPLTRDAQAHRLFPTMKSMDPRIVAGSGRAQRQFDIESLICMARYNDVAISALNVVQVLVESGVLSYNPDVSNGIDQRPGMGVRNLMQVAGLIGAYEARSYKEWRSTGPRESKVAKQRAITRQILYRYFFPHTAPPLKKITAQRMRQWENRDTKFEEPFVRCMQKGVNEGHKAMYAALLSEMRNTVGMVLKGGNVRQTVDVDARPCYPL